MSNQVRSISHEIKIGELEFPENPNSFWKSKQSLLSIDVLYNKLFCPFCYEMSVYPSTRTTYNNGTSSVGARYPNNGCTFNIMPSDRYNKKLHESMAKVIGDNLDVIKEWYFSDRSHEDTQKVFDILSKAVGMKK